jgi:hypothetical protein
VLTDKDREKLAKSRGFRTRVDLKCKDCIYDPLAGGTWRKQVKNCTSVDCPLWAIRSGA